MTTEEAEEQLIPPVKVGDILEDLEISETGAKNDGVTRFNTFVIFVKGSKVGERARVKIVRVAARYAVGVKV